MTEDPTPLELSVRMARHAERLEACQRPGPLFPVEDPAALRAAAREVRTAAQRSRTPAPPVRRG